MMKYINGFVVFSVVLLVIAIVYLLMMQPAASVELNEFTTRMGSNGYWLSPQNRNISKVLIKNSYRTGISELNLQQEPYFISFESSDENLYFGVDLHTEYYVQTFMQSGGYRSDLSDINEIQNIYSSGEFFDQSVVISTNPISGDVLLSYIHLVKYERI